MAFPAVLRHRLFAGRGLEPFQPSLLQCSVDWLFSAVAGFSYRLGTMETWRHILCVAPLRCRYGSPWIPQVITHMREKLQFIARENAKLKSELARLDQELASQRDLVRAPQRGSGCAR